MAEVDNICGKIARVIFVIINLLLAVIGIAALALGSYVVHIGRVEGAISALIAGGAVLIVGGIIVILITSAGLYGAVSLSKIMLGIYILCLVVIILLEIVGAVLGFVYRGKVTTFATNVYLEAIENYGSGSLNRLIDVAQEKGRCCGWNSTDNWISSSYYNRTMQYPDSCECTLPNQNCIQVVSTNQTIWNATCQASVTNFLQKNLGVVGGIGAAIAVIQLIPLLLAIVLMCTISNEYSQV